LTEEAEAKKLVNESTRWEQARIRKEIEEKELEEARGFLAYAKKWKGKKGKKATRDGVSSFCSWFSFWWLLMIVGLWHVYHLFLLLSSLHRVYIPFFFHLVKINRPWQNKWMIGRMDRWMKWCFITSFILCNYLGSALLCTTTNDFPSY